MKISLRGQMFLKVLQRAQYGTLFITFPDQTVQVCGHGVPHINVRVEKWSALDLLFDKGDLGLAEAIINGLVEVDDAAALVEWACRNDQALGRAVYGKWYGTLVAKVRHYLHRNERSQAQKNIMAHYDLGNAFYSLWLDPTMTYSSALFKNPNQSLQEAQMEKYDRIIDALDLRESDHLLEIGCGWGGFFSRAVERTGCRITAVANSPEQVRFNTEKIKNNKMSQHVKLIQQDYRDIEGHFDKVASIEMIEAVGEEYWNSFFGKVRASLKLKGQAVIQGITIREDLFYSYKKSTDFIQQYVFPGGMLLTNKLFQQIGDKNNLSLQETFEFGMDYADTLKAWRINFNKVLPDVRAMGFDERFIRMWNLYLSYCEGAFRAKRINVGQYTFA